LVFAPGEAYQFDWSYEIVIVAGVTTPVTGLALAVLAGVYLPARHGRRR
jgi:hypothetical protein